MPAALQVPGGAGIRVSGVRGLLRRSAASVGNHLALCFCAGARRSKAMLAAQCNLVCSSCPLLSAGRASAAPSPHSGHDANRLPPAWQRRHSSPEHVSPRMASGLYPGCLITLLLLCSFEQVIKIFSFPTCCRAPEVGQDFSRRRALGLESEDCSGPASL